MNSALPETPTLESLAKEMQDLRDRMEDLEDLLELRAAVERNAGKPGAAWQEAKAKLEID
jgi:hypothetical protein